LYFLGRRKKEDGHVEGILKNLFTLNLFT